ncbi:MAG: CotH kinase family protein [Melioribacteraceae bacterium]|nr:CotH kinase family protein [Melioribacteraceae bacterium]MCF8355356.1 CotH kinase family protein [Melioribacteraceae bacterium]MCF8395168.1 CotH kinase family protein [Melioribacteraceae bacterium]MCF8420263.1 CotH kinase family protein [Melioribacteraceae bacterium]
MKFALMIIVFCNSFNYAQSDESWKVYDDSQVAIINIAMDPADLEYIFDNLYDDVEKPAVVHYQNAYINETVDSVGIRIRGNTSRDSQKKSFKLSFNAFESGRKFYGLEKMNINGEHNDPSIVRSKLCWDLFAKSGMIASRANHAEVYINGDYYGLYISVEHIDEEFVNKNYDDDSGNLWKCLWPADLDYLSDNPNSYKLMSGGRRVYELKTNTDEDDYTNLARFIRILNLTPIENLPDSLEKILHVPEVLKYLAWDVLMGSWDDYWGNKNNFYLYHDPSVDKFHIIPYDYDNTLGIDWSGIDWATADIYNFPNISGGPRPLAERLLQIPAYRDLYTHYLEFFRDEIFKLWNWENEILDIQAMISNSAIEDTYRTLDYGFTVADFFESYTSSHFEKLHVRWGLREFIIDRSESLDDQFEYLDAAPYAYGIDYYPKNPLPTDSIYVAVSAFSHTGISNAQILVYPEDLTIVYNYPLTYNPIESTLIVDEYDRWFGVIPPLGEGGSAEFEIYFLDNNINESTYPLNGKIKIEAAEVSSSSILINEFLASNESAYTDPHGEFDDWLEIYNNSVEPVLLTGMYLTDKQDNLTKWQFTQDDLYIAAGEFLIVWCDEDSGQVGLHSNFKLDADGEYIALVSGNGNTIIDEIEFGTQQSDISFGRYPDAYEHWGSMEPTPGFSNSPVSVEEKDEVVRDFKLSVFPNPFNPSTNIQFELPEQSDVDLTVFNLLGEKVWQKKLTAQKPGIHKINFTPDYSIASGVYFVSIRAGKFSDAKKIVLMR